MLVSRSRLGGQLRGIRLTLCVPTGDLPSLHCG